jgi:hypothetical protein
MKGLACSAVMALAFLCPNWIAASPITLEGALAKGYVELDATGLGGYSGEVLKVKLKNLYKKDLEVTIPAGQIFEVGDSSLQNLMVAKEETLLVESGKIRIAKLHTFCIEARDGSPGEGSSFRVGKMAVGNLLAFAQYLSLENLYKNAYAQNAVWAVSDDERLEGIGDQALAKYVANLLGKPEPQYHVQYQQPDQSRLLPGSPVWEMQEALSMNGLFYYTLDSDRLVNFELYNEAGEMVHAFSKNRQQKRGYHKFRFEFKISNLPKGKYFARLTSGGRTIEELPVEF